MQVVNNLYLIYDQTGLSSLIPIYKTTNANNEVNFYAADNLKPINFTREYLEEAVKINIPEFTIDSQGYQILFFLLVEHTNGELPEINDYRELSKYIQLLILQMTNQGQINVLQTPKQITKPDTGYRVMYSNKLKAFNEQLEDLNLKQYPEEYQNILNNFVRLHSHKDITIDALTKLQNSNLIITNIPHIDINILSHLDYDFITYLSRFSVYLQELIKSDNFFIQYITTHYGTNILKEKDLLDDNIIKLYNIKPTIPTYKQYLNLLLRNDNIFPWSTINNLIIEGKYYNVKYLVDKYQIDVYDLDAVAIGASRNMKIVDLLNPSNDDFETINSILQGASKTNPEWFEILRERFGIEQNIYLFRVYIRDAFYGNNLEMVKYLRDVYQADLQGLIQAIEFGWIDTLYELLHRNMKQINRFNLEHEFDNNDDNVSPTLTLLQYVFHSQILNINGIRDIFQEIIDAEININDPDDSAEGSFWYYNILPLIESIGETGDDKIISFFLNRLNILFAFNNSVKSRFYLELLNNIIKSGNLTLFKKYFDVVKVMFLNFEDENGEYIGSENMEQLFGKDLSDIEIGKDLSNEEIENIKDRILLQMLDMNMVVKSCNMRMISYFESLGLLNGKIVEPIKLHKLYVGANDKFINSIVYTLNAKNIDIYDHLSPKLIDSEYLSKKYSISRDILETESGMSGNNNNIYEPLLYTLYQRGVINLHYMIIDVAFQQDPARDIKELIWILKLTPLQFISILKSMDTKIYSSFYSTIPILISDNYLTQDQVQFVYDVNK